MMPRGGPPLPPAQIALFKKWIDSGAPSGEIGKEQPSAHPTLAALPMPANPAALPVRVPTLLKPTVSLLGKEPPKDATLALALTVGPLPPITALAFSPDGKRLAVGTYRAVTLWDTATGQPVASLTRLTGTVQSVAFRPDGTLLAVAGGAPGASGEVKVFDTKTFAPVGPPLEGHTDVVYSVAWSPDGARLATGSQDKTARIWEWPSGKLLKTLSDHSDAVTRVCFAPDGKSLYTASLDHNVRRFDVATGNVLRVFTGHSDGVTALAISPDGRGVVSAGPEPRLRWWNPDDGSTTRYSDGSSDTVNEIVFSKDGKFLASASADHLIRLWDAGNAGQQRALQGSSDWVYAVALSPDGKFAAGGGSDGILRLWETATGRLRLALLFWPPTGKATTPEWVTLTPEGYFDGSPAWAARLGFALQDKPLATPALKAFAISLHQPESVVKAWQGSPLDAAKPPDAKVPQPAPPQK
jgi:WD40 repeat protein